MSQKLLFYTLAFLGHSLPLVTHGDMRRLQLSSAPVVMCRWLSPRLLLLVSTGQQLQHVAQPASH